MSSSDVERAFGMMGGCHRDAPIFHQKAERVQGHVFVASLAFLLDRALEKKLKSAGLDISSREAWQLLKTVRVVEIGLGNQETTRSVTHGSFVRRKSSGFRGSRMPIRRPEKPEIGRHSDTCKIPVFPGMKVQRFGSPSPFAYAGLAGSFPSSVSHGGGIWKSLQFQQGQW